MHRSKSPPLFDHLVSASEQAIRRIYAEGLGSLKVDNKLEFSRILDGKIARPFTLEDAIYIRCGLPVQFDVVDPVKRQSPARNPVAEWIDGGQSIFVR